MVELHFGGSGSDYEIVTELIARYIHEMITDFGVRLEPLLLDLCETIGGGIAAMEIKRAMTEHPVIEYDELSEKAKNEYIKNANVLLQKLNDVGYMITTHGGKLG